jgi:hypothetical protein
MTMFKVEELEAGPLLDQAVLLAMGAMRVLDPPANAPANVRERWPDGGCLVLVDGGNMAFYGAPPPFSTDWGIGGPALIDKRRLSIISSDDCWLAGNDASRSAGSRVGRAAASGGCIPSHRRRQSTRRGLAPMTATIPGCTGGAPQPQSRAWHPRPKSTTSASSQPGGLA